MSPRMVECPCGCGGTWEASTGRGQPRKWHADPCRKRGERRRPDWHRGLTEAEIKAIEVKLAEYAQHRADVAEAMHNRRPGDDDSKRRRLAPQDDHGGTWGAWDDISQSWQNTNVWRPSNLKGPGTYNARFYLGGLPDLDERGRRLGPLKNVERLMVHTERRVREIEMAQADAPVTVAVLRAEESVADVADVVELPGEAGDLEEAA